MTETTTIPTIAEQRKVLLSALQHGPLTTRQAEALGIRQPRDRIFELRKDGYQILNVRMGREGIYMLRVSHEPQAA